MVAAKIVCPRCQAVMKSAKPLPVGASINCVKCGLSFTISQDPVSAGGSTTVGEKTEPKVGTLVAPKKAKTDSPSPAVNSAPSPMAATANGPPSPAVGPAAASLSPQEPSSEADGRRKRLALVLAGVALLLCLGAGLIILAFVSSTPAPPPPQDTYGELPEPLPPALLVRVKPLISLSPEEEEQVDNMIRRGVDWLKKEQSENGKYPGGYEAMRGLTLLECGVLPSDPAVQKAAAYVRKLSPSTTKTYCLFLFILFLDKLNDPVDKALISKLTLRLVGGQTAQGGWTYECPVLPPRHEEALLVSLGTAGRRGGDKPQRGKTERGQEIPEPIRNHPALRHSGKEKGDFFRHGGGDNSNTQFAILALWAARRHQLPVDPSLQLVVRRFRQSQYPDGSWHYTAGHRIASSQKLPTMTCAGLLGLAVSYGLNTEALRSSGPQQDPQIKKALGHLSKYLGEIRTRGKDKPKATEMYFLWSVERVAVLYQLPTIGNKEWYRWGMNLLAAHQQPDGHWGIHLGPGATDLVDTCFALLFLQRVNLAQDLTDKLRELMAQEAAATERKE